MLITFAAALEKFCCCLECNLIGSSDLSNTSISCNLQKDFFSLYVYTISGTDAVNKDKIGRESTIGRDFHLWQQQINDAQIRS